jgi:DNA-binding NtrC family response regulator
MDDEDAFRNGLVANLEDDGHQVIECADPGEAPSLPQLADVGAVVVDYQMPQMDGLSFADALHAVHPNVPVVLATSYWTADIEEQIAVRKFVTLCRKPLDYDQLHDLIHQLAT